MAWGDGLASDTTVRDIARVSVGGERFRFRISNEFGTSPLVVDAATVGLQAAGAAVVPGTLRDLTFHGAPTVTISAGGVAYSDPARLVVKPLQGVAVSIYVAAPGTRVTSHPCCSSMAPTSFIAPNGAGNLAGRLSGSGFTVASGGSRLLDAIEVDRPGLRGSIVALGDSITDGFLATRRWTDVLAARIARLPVGDQMGVVNEGIAGNTLTGLGPRYWGPKFGPSGVDRLGPDVLSLAGVSDLVVLLGTNDLSLGATPAMLESGFRTIERRAHAAGIKVFLATITPRALGVGWSAQMERYRLAVNNWIRASSGADGVVAFARSMGDTFGGACVPDAMYAPYDSGDHLHPSAAGQVAMGNALPTSLFGIPNAPLETPMVRVRPTPGCAAAPGSAGLALAAGAVHAGPTGHGYPIARDLVLGLLAGLLALWLFGAAITARTATSRA